MMYLLQVTLCWGTFYLLYVLLLSRETFFHINRWYLLATLALGIAIPMVDWHTLFFSNNHPIVIPLDQFHYSIQSITATPEVITAETTWQEVLWLIYQAGTLLFTLRFSYGLWQIWQVYRRSEVVQHGKYKIVYTDSEHLPYSFFNCLFWSKQFDTNYTEQQQILRHEEAHINGWHTVDVLFMEILGILFWCSPMIYLYRASMRNVHEYLADAWVLQTTTKKAYGRLLLSQSLSGFQIALANHFIHSQLKKRIIMMTRNHSPKRAMMKYLWMLPIVVLAVLIFSKRDQFPTNKNVATASLSAEADYEQATQELLNTHDPIHKVVEEMPRFPGCEDKEDGEVRQECANQKLLQFIYSNIKYPQAARDAGIQGTSVVSFVVEKDGSITELKMLRSPGEGAFDEEVLRVTGAMPKWIPGKHEGEIVRVEFKLPVKFKLEDDGDATPTNATPPNANDIFKVVDEMPRFPGCEELAGEARKECSQTKLLEFIYSNIKYPESGRDAGIEGISVVGFVVEKDGTISSSEIKRSIGSDFDETILEVVAQMPKWIAGKQAGENVRVQFHLPVKFKLADDAESKTEMKEKDLVGADAPIMFANAMNERLVVQDLKISPNPSSGIFDMSFTAAAGPTKVQVLTVEGRTVFSWYASDFDGQDDIVINLQYPPSGTYYVRIMQGDKVHIEPIIVQK